MTEKSTIDYNNGCDDNYDSNDGNFDDNDDKTYKYYEFLEQKNHFF